jgi:hypothetical protein
MAHHFAAIQNKTANIRLPLMPSFAFLIRRGHLDSNRLKPHG